MAEPASQFRLDKLADGLYFGESPRWREGTLYISDMTGCTIYAIDAMGTKSALLKVEKQPNGMAFTDDGTLIYSSMFDNKLYSYKDGQSQLYADVSSVMTGYCGDMVIDARGRIYLDDTGARVLHGETPCPGRLILIDTDKRARSVAEDIVFANGISIDSSGQKLFLSALYAYQLLQFNIEEDSGALSDRTVNWETKDLPMAADKQWNRDCGIDGLCMDAEDALWLSMLGHNAFVRKDVHGTVTHRIEVDGDATACTLGGEDGKTLFLVVNKVPEGRGLFDAMVARETKCTIYTTKVDVGRGKARP